MKVQDLVKYFAVSPIGNYGPISGDMAILAALFLQGDLLQGIFISSLMTAGALQVVSSVLASIDDDFLPKEGKAEHSQALGNSSDMANDNDLSLDREKQSKKGHTPKI